MTATILRGDARRLPLADASIDLIVTSPPYWALRSYTDGGEHYDGQIGAEPTPAAYVDSLIECTREWTRVLKPSGSLWINLGDKYNSAASGQNLRDAAGKDGRGSKRYDGARGKALRTAPPKSLLGLPWRYALRCIDDLGLILRAEVIWSKCLSGGARVYARTSTGDRPIMMRDLVRSYRVEDVQLWNGQRWTQVIGWERTSDRDGAIEIEFRTGERVGCTTNHRWPTSRGVLRANELTIGDVIESTRLPQPDQPRTPALLPDDDIGWLIGLYIAEGSRSEMTVQFAGHVREDARHARLARIAAALDGTCNVYQTGENTATANLHGSVIVGVIDRYVSPGTAKTKRLRHAAWQRTDAFLAALVDGYLSGDGHYDAKNDRWRLGFTANDEWTADLRTLAARLGAVIKLRRAQHAGSYGTFPGWRGEWRWTRSAHHNAKSDGEIVAIQASRARDFYDVEVTDDPHLFALASGILTHNSNGLPESVTDRVRRSHETWFHLVKSSRYFCAVDSIREPHANPGKNYGPNGAGATALRARNASHAAIDGTDDSGEYRGANPSGKLPGSVWEIATQPLKVPANLGVDHFAAFPMEWPRRIISGWSPPEGTVLDPFGGTGTTALVAHALGRRGVSVDMSADYCRLARWRTTDPGRIASAMQVEKPPVELPGQQDLMSLIDGEAA